MRATTTIFLFMLFLRSYAQVQKDSMPTLRPQNIDSSMVKVPKGGQENMPTLNPDDNNQPDIYAVDPKKKKKDRKKRN